MTRRDSAIDPALQQFLVDHLGIAPSGSQAERAGSRWSVTTPLWVWRGSGDGPLPKAAWYFLTISGPAASAIRTAAGARTGGFGSVKIAAQIGTTRWTTSLFPSKQADGFLLQVKADVRRREQLVADALVTVALTLG
jgi:hypothetical protein